MSLPNTLAENFLECVCEVGLVLLVWFWTQRLTIQPMLVCNPLWCAASNECNPSASAHNFSSVGVAGKSHHIQHDCLVMDIRASI